MERDGAFRALGGRVLVRGRGKAHWTPDRLMPMRRAAVGFGVAMVTTVAATASASGAHHEPPGTIALSATCTSVEASFTPAQGGWQGQLFLLEPRLIVNRADGAVFTSIGWAASKKSRTSNSRCRGKDSQCLPVPAATASPSS